MIEPVAIYVKTFVKGLAMTHIELSHVFIVNASVLIMGPIAFEAETRCKICVTHVLIGLEEPSLIG